MHLEAKKDYPMDNQPVRRRWQSLKVDGEVLCHLQRQAQTMDRAFGSFEECVKDGVMSACGAYGTAPLDRIYRCIEQRMEKYFDEGKAVPSDFKTYLEFCAILY